MMKTPKGSTAYLVTVPARGHQTFMVESATSKADAIRQAKEDRADPVVGELDVLCWSSATAEKDE